MHAREVVLELEEGSDRAAPGAAVTVALCGHWKHDGACRWPHRTSVASQDGRVLRARVLVAAPRPELPEVLARVATALGKGELTDGDGCIHRWRVLREEESAPREGEESLVQELSRAGAGT